MTTDIEWFCDNCGEPINDFDGYGYVRPAEAMRKYLDDEEMRRAGWPFSEIPLVEWTVTHDHCDPESCDAPLHYCFEISDVCTVDRLLRFDRHLGTKEWVVATNWRQLMTDTWAASEHEAAKREMRHA